VPRHLLTLRREDILIRSKKAEYADTTGRMRVRHLAGGVGAHVDRGDLVQLVAHARVDVDHLEISAQTSGVSARVVD